MIRSATVLAAVVAVAATLTACGSDSSPQSAAESRRAEITAAIGPTTSAAAHTSGPTIDLASVDVCALLTAADANSVAHAEMLDPFLDSSTAYTYTATKQTGGCAIRIVSPDGNGQGSAVIRVASAKGFVVPPNGKQIAGLGNEAFDTGVSPVVRLGNAKVYTDESSFPDSINVALLRKIVPKLEAAAR